MRYEIRPTTHPAGIATVRRLFRAYADELGVDLCFQGFEAELAGLPGRYAEPTGVLLLGQSDTGEPAGCIALRALDAQVCEMKRLYVCPPFRGTGLGRRLAEAVLEAARQRGYRRICLDTLPDMLPAIAMYRSLGFGDVAPYTENPLPGVLFLACELGVAPG